MSFVATHFEIFTNVVSSEAVGEGEDGVFEGDCSNNIYDSVTVCKVNFSS